MTANFIHTLGTYLKDEKLSNLAIPVLLKCVMQQTAEASDVR